MRGLIFTYLVVSAILFFSSCSDKQYQLLFNEKKTITDSASIKSATNLSEYRIKSQDLLQIRNLQNSKSIADMNPSSAASSGQEPNATQPETFQVEEDGTIPLTGLGHVHVAGLTRYGAQKMIEDMYRKDLLKNPVIELKIVNLKVTILGEIRSQGNYTLTKDRTTLVELIGEAGGLTESADERNIKIIRGTENDPKITVIDLNNIKSIDDPVSILQSGDIIYVAQNKRAARASNLQNFSTVFQPLLLIFNTALIIFTLAHK